MTWSGVATIVLGFSSEELEPDGARESEPGAGAVADREEFCYRELGLCIAQDRSTFETFEKRYNQDIHNWEIKPACVLCGATHGWCFVRLRHT